jgi:parallel beta helix pectate lyase-like protein
VQNNSFYDFVTAPGVHGDGIQIFTSRTTTAAHDILISGNLVARGNGTPEQGIFVQDEVKTLPFHNVTIEDNAVIGEQWNGIYLSHATGDVQIRNNIIASWTGANVVRGGDTDYISWLRLGDLGGATVAVTGNQAQAFLVGLPPKLLPPPPSNVKLGRIDDRGAALSRKWLASHGAALGTLPAGLLQQLGAGANDAAAGAPNPALSTDRE